MSSAVRRAVYRIGDLVEVQRPIDLGHDLLGALVMGSDHDAIGMLEVVDCRSFAQEFRIRHHGDVGVGTSLANDALDFVAGADRHGRLGDDHREAVERRRYLAGGVVDVGQIRMAVAAPRWRADGDKNCIGGADWFVKRRW